MAYTAGIVTILALVLGNFQAMKTAWVEEMLSTLPQVGFLLAAIVIVCNSTFKHPYGYHRTMNIGHLVASFALIVVGVILAYETAILLVKAEHPSRGNNPKHQSCLRLPMTMAVRLRCAPYHGHLGSGLSAFHRSHTASPPAIENPPRTISLLPSGCSAPTN